MKIVLDGLMMMMSVRTKATQKCHVNLPIPRSMITILSLENLCALNYCRRIVFSVSSFSKRFLTFSMPLISLTFRSAFLCFSTFSMNASPAL